MASYGSGEASLDEPLLLLSFGMCSFMYSTCPNVTVLGLLMPSLNNSYCLNFRLESRISSMFGVRPVSVNMQTEFFRVNRGSSARVISLLWELSVRLKLVSLLVFSRLACSLSLSRKKLRSRFSF
jgi:hypothetical protein